MRVISSAFVHDAAIPKRHSCQGENISPHLSWRDIPEGTRSFALVFDDPDVPIGSFVHWLLYDIPVNVVDLPEALTPETVALFGAKHGRNGFGRVSYDGPCPPTGVFHTYRFTIFALKEPLGLPPGANMRLVRKAMSGKIIASKSLNGRYSRVTLNQFIRAVLHH